MNASKTHAIARRDAPKTEPMMVRLPTDMATEVRKRADRGDRTVSQQLRRLINIGLREESRRRNA